LTQIDNIVILQFTVFAKPIDNETLTNWLSLTIGGGLSVFSGLLMGMELRYPKNTRAN
jgi:hypothetical protein